MRVARAVAECSERSGCAQAQSMRNQVPQVLRMGVARRSRVGWLMSAVFTACLIAGTARTAPAQSAEELESACRDELQPAPQRIGACTRLIEKSGDAAVRADAFLQRGVLHELGGEAETAVQDYTESIKLDPSNALARFNRGNAYDQLGHFDLAIADYNEAIKLDPKEADYFNNRGQAYDHKGQHDLAIADYTEAARLDATNARPLYNRGLAHANKGDYQRAITDFDQAIKLSPADADLYVARGAAHEELGEESAAKADYAKALEIDPDSEDAREGLSRLGG
jgi:tetratricopeptide (TPR) repeat protein